MLIHQKKPSITPFPKQLAILGQIHQPPINWQIAHLETPATAYKFELKTANGYEMSDYINESLLNEAQRKAQAADLAILCVATETDRLPLPQYQLIRSVALVQPQLWVFAWSAITLSTPWASKTKAIFHVPNICSEQAFVEAIKSNTI
ncbi:MAG: hypothetical protein AAGI23_18220 [Bacteroidota bacterium]